MNTLRFALRIVFYSFMPISILFLVGCSMTNVALKDLNYPGEMRSFVKKISSFGKSKNPDFVIIPQNGVEVLYDADDHVDKAYLDAIDAIGQESLNYGYDGDNRKTPVQERDYLFKFLDVLRNDGKAVLVTDYCWEKSFVDNSYRINSKKGYISFAANKRSLNSIPSYPPKPYNSNNLNIVKVTDAKNFLYIINDSGFASKQSFLEAIKRTDYDLIIMDLFFQGYEPFKKEEITSLKRKSSGGSRLVISYMSIREAEDYRYYWQKNCSKHKPQWLEKENPDWKGNYKVRYWDRDWQKIIVGANDSYLNKILDAGFDGVYLDIIDGYWYFKEKYGRK